MTTSEMHVMFRQYAQQMGMQNVRAILPEQIDLLLNTSVMDMTNQIIKENIGITNDRVITDNSKIGQINALRSLYHVKLIEMSPFSSQLTETRAFAFNASDRNTGRMTTNFEKISDSNIIPDYMFLVDFSLNYKKVKNGQGYNGKNGIKRDGTVNILNPSSTIKFEDVSMFGKANLQDVVTPPNPTFVQDYSKVNMVASDTIFENLKLDDTFKVEVYNPEVDKYQELEFGIETSDSTTAAVCRTPGFTNKYLGVQASKDLSQYLGLDSYILTDNFSDGDETIGESVILNPVKPNNGAKESEYVAPEFDDDSIETNFFPVRIIDDAYLADTLNDFVLKNRLRTPIIVTYNVNSGTNFDIYIDKFIKNTKGKYTLEGDLIPYILRMSYIAKPAEIHYREDIGGVNDECDLPSYMHVDIVKHSVDLYRTALNGALMSAQGQEQQARQENTRNNYRNEGYNQQ